MYLEDSDNCDTSIWKSTCSWKILSKLVFTAANCFLANKVKNYNSLVLSKSIEHSKDKVSASSCRSLVHIHQGIYREGHTSNSNIYFAYLPQQINSRTTGKRTQCTRINVRELISIL